MIRDDKDDLEATQGQGLEWDGIVDVTRDEDNGRRGRVIEGEHEHVSEDHLVHQILGTSRERVHAGHSAGLQLLTEGGRDGLALGKGFDLEDGTKLRELVSQTTNNLSPAQLGPCVDGTVLEIPQNASWLESSGGCSIIWEKGVSIY